jgi:hypothetical protein
VQADHCYRMGAQRFVSVYSFNTPADELFEDPQKRIRFGPVFAQFFAQ